MISFFVPLIPAAKGRPRTRVIPTRGGPRATIFTPPETARAEQEFVALAAPHAPERPLEGALAVSLLFVLPIPASKPTWWREAAAARRVWPKGRPDLDNLIKLSTDALTRSGHWWKDDSQIVQIDAEKSYGASPGTHVTIQELPEVERQEWARIAASHGSFIGPPPGRPPTRA